MTLFSATANPFCRLSYLAPSIPERVVHSGERVCSMPSQLARKGTAMSFQISHCADANHHQPTVSPAPTSRRAFLREALRLGAISAAIVLPGKCVLAQTSTRDIQVRVYKQPRPGKFEFLGNVQLRLCNGRKGVTRTQGGVRGTAEFKDVNCKNQYADALIGSRWIRSSRSEYVGRVLRLDVVVP